MSFTPEQKEATTQARSTQNATHRATVTALEEVLHTPFPVLDHGFIRVVDYMGDDQAIVQAARVSYGKGTKKTSQDRGLIRYLMRHRHSTPFEMCEIKCHIKLPIFVARQWIRHRTANVNEYSARYSILGKEFYIPSVDTLSPQSTTNNQGREGKLTQDESQKVLDLLRHDAQTCYDHYTWMMNRDENDTPLDTSRQGLSRELARMNLTLNYYTEWYWKIDLHNLMHFISLRADPHAQYEIRVYADILADILKVWTPLTYEAFQDYRVGGAYLSRGGLKVIQNLLKGTPISRQDSGLSPREWRELEATLGFSLESSDKS